MEQKMIENILNKYVIEAQSMGRSVILADRIDEVADDIHQFLLQQTQCTTLRELLIAKVDEIDKVRDRKEKQGLQTGVETGIVLGLKIAFQLIDDCPPVA